MIDVLVVFGTEPKVVAAVQLGVGKWQPLRSFYAVGKIEDQWKTVAHWVVFEYITVFPGYPDSVILIYVQVVQVRKLLGRIVVHHQRVVGKLFSVVPINSLVCQKPHVPFPVLFHGNDPTTA